MSSFKFFFLWVAFCFAKNRLFRVTYALRATFIPSLRFGTGYASPYNPCHSLKLKNSKLNLNVNNIFKERFIRLMTMKENIIAKLTLKNDKYACALADKIISESQETDEWYEYFDDFATLLDHPKSLVRNRALYILAANAQWDEENRFDGIISDYLLHITDEKPITARQCVKALVQVGVAKPQYIPRIVSCLKAADLSKYKDSMRPLIEKDIEETERILTNYNTVKL